MLHRSIPQSSMVGEFAAPFFKLSASERVDMASPATRQGRGHHEEFQSYVLRMRSFFFSFRSLFRHGELLLLLSYLCS